MTNKEPNQYNRLLLALCGEVAARLRTVRLPRWSSLDKGLRVVLAVVSFLTLTLTVMHREDADGYQATHLFFMPRRHWEMDNGRGMLYEPAYYSRMDQAILLEEVSSAPFTALFEIEGYYDEYEEFEIVSLPLPQPRAERTTAYREWLAQAQADYTTWFVHTRAAYEEWLRSQAQAFDNWLTGQSENYKATYAQELAEQEQATQSEGAKLGDGEGTSGKRTQGGTVRRAPHAPAFGSYELPVANSDLDGTAISWQYAVIGHANLRPVMWRDDTITPPPRG